MSPRLRVASVVALAALGSACAGKSNDPPPSNGNAGLACLTDLPTYCCSDAAPKDCVADFTTASACGTWPAGTTVRVYATPCQGLRAVRVQGDSWSTFYLYASDGSLRAIGDNAASVQDPRDTTIECGAGPSGFTVPGDCGTTWESATGAQACAGGSPQPTSLCR